MGYYDDDETYDQYNGTYVHDVEGWSDQMINDALDGEPYDTVFDAGIRDTFLVANKKLVETL